MKRGKPEKYEKLVQAVLVVLMAAAMCFMIHGGSAMLTLSDKALSGEKEPVCIVVDAGHGGIDPGKVGIDGSLEKDINLAIALKLKTFLQMQDIQVILTRDSDKGLYEENAANKKVQDMKNRVGIIEDAKPELTVSIHQNSYHEEYVHGAQVFYYEGSEDSKALAENIQQVMVVNLDKNNKRYAKANDSYYLLKKTSSPIVIVECGFLSNSEEAQKLSSEAYQEKVAWAIHLGVLQYLNQGKP